MLKLKALITHFYVIFILTPTSCIHGARDLYRNTDGGFGEELMFTQNGLSNAKIVQWNLGDGFKMFGEESQTAFVHFSGVLTFDPSSARKLSILNCQRQPDTTINFIAPYWRHYDHGKISVMEYDKNAVVVEPPSSSSIIPSTIESTLSLKTSSDTLTTTPVLVVATSSVLPSSSDAVATSSIIPATSISPSISVLQSESIEPSLSTTTTSSMLSSNVQPIPTESQATTTTESTQTIDQSATTTEETNQSTTTQTIENADQSTTTTEEINQSTTTTTSKPITENVVADELSQSNHRSRRNANNQDTINPLQFPIEHLTAIATDLTEAFETGKQLNRVKVKQRKNLTADRIERVIVFTWLDMYSDAETNSNKRNRHSFQTLLIKIGDEWYVQNYYAVLSSNGNFDVNRNEEGQTCGHATVGISRFLRDVLPQSDEDGLHRGVYHLTTIPTVAEIYTNEWTWRDLGSWVYDLNPDVENQPAPITFNCVNDAQDHAKCIILFASDQARNSRRRKRRNISFVQKLAEKLTSIFTNRNRRPTVPPTTTKVGKPTIQPQGVTIPDELLTIPTTPAFSEPKEQLNITEAAQTIANRYCRYRDPGLYKLPLICDVFISCSVGGNARPIACPKGTGFNPRINVCDHASYYECNTDDVLGNHLIPKSRTQPKHRNFCEYKGFGIYPDPLSCTHYYACTNARSIRMACPVGLHFQPDGTKKNGRCEFAFKVKCMEGKRPKRV